MRIFLESSLDENISIITVDVDYVTFTKRSLDTIPSSKRLNASFWESFKQDHYYRMDFYLNDLIYATFIYDGSKLDDDFYINDARAIITQLYEEGSLILKETDFRLFL